MAPNRPVFAAKMPAVDSSMHLRPAGCVRRAPAPSTCAPPALIPQTETTRTRPATLDDSPFTLSIVALCPRDASTPPAARRMAARRMDRRAPPDAQHAHAHALSRLVHARDARAQDGASTTSANGEQVPMPEEAIIPTPAGICGDPMVPYGRGESGPVFRVD